MTVTSADVVGFWRDAGPKMWFAKDESFDANIRTRFETAHMTAAARALDGWAETPEGALALLLLLDQFPRNMYRGGAHAFATDPLARRIARAALAKGHDRAVEAEFRGFFYLPFEHAEDMADQELSIRLHCQWVTEGRKPNDLVWAEKHADIIRRFGRFPHRNLALGRLSTAAERAFLEAGGFAG